MLTNSANLIRRLPRPLSRLIRDALVYPRYWKHAHTCRLGYREHGHNYPNPILFVMGIPKSGSTWLERMISSYPGYGELLIPEASLAPVGMFNLPEDTFTRMRDMLVLTKMHIRGNEHNVRILHESDVPYVILYRDFRDVCISQYHYIKLTPWHNLYDETVQMSLSGYIDFFRDYALTDFCEWVDDWERMRDPSRSLMVRYEDLLENPHESLRRILNVYELPASDERINEMVERNTFTRLSGGRSPGEESGSSFFRKGQAGDWKNHFSDAQAEGFRRVAGDWFRRHGYD